MPKLFKCRFHDDSTPSMAVYEDGRYYCFGCRASGKVDKDMQDDLGIVDFSDMGYGGSKTPIKVDKSKYYPLSNKGIQFLRSRNIKVSTAIQYGMTENSAGDILLYPLYKEHGEITGYQIRYMDQSKSGIKYKLIPEKGKYPTYSCVGVFKENNPIIYIVESVFDALVINQREGHPCIVLLGTQMPGAVRWILNNYKCNFVRIWFDDDAILDACVHADILRSNLMDSEIQVIEQGNPYEYYNYHDKLQEKHINV